MTENTLSEWRGQIDKDMHRLTNQVSSLTSAIGEMGAYQRSSAERIDRLADAWEQDRQNSSTPEWDTRSVLGVVAGCMFAGIVGITTLMYGMATYVDMHIDKATGPLAGLQAWMEDKDEFQKQVHFETGKHEHETKIIEEKLAHFDELDHRRDERIIQLEKQAAAAEVSRKAMGDYMREHNMSHHSGG